jgi:hypothetical protein
MQLAGFIVAVLALLVSAYVGVRQLIVQQRANRTSDAVGQLERQRRHDEMTPRFRFTYEHQGGDTVRLKLALAGPVGLSRLDSVVLTIRDDLVDRGQVTAGGPTAEEIRDQLWGPYRLRPGVSGADETGRAASPAPVNRGEALYYVLEPSFPPPWNPDTAMWQREYDSKPLRLTVTCTQDGDMWELPEEVIIEAQSRPNVRWLGTPEG